MRILIAILLVSVLAGAAAPAAVQAQGITKKIKQTAKERVKNRTSQTEQNIVQHSGNAVDSTMAPAGKRADSIVNAAGGAAARLPRKAGELLGQSLRDGGADAQLRNALKTGRGVLPEIAFVPGSAKFAEGAEPHLMRLAEAMEAVGGMFLIESYVEPGSKAAQAQALSQARAAAVKAWLVDDGLGHSTLFTIGRGAAPDENGNATARIEVARVQ